MKKYTIAIAGTTQRTTLCAEVLKKSELFDISWILTPKPKPIGRKKIMTPNPVDIFAKENNISVVYIEKKIDELVKEKILKKTNNLSEDNTPDFLLVVDFGYLIPKWLLKLPKIAPFNIHPSELPKWRGSSPGQFSILFNDAESAVTLMVMNERLDQGPIIYQDFFKVDPNWTQTEYYKHAFKLMCDGLDNKIAKFGTNTKMTKPQPKKSPTITASILKKDQTFVDWGIVKVAMKGGNIEDLTQKKTSIPIELSTLLTSALQHNKSLAITLERASKAFNPWPNLWTIIPTKNGKKRMKLLKLNTKTSNNKIKLIIETAQVEGKNTGLWNDIKNIVLS